MSGTRGGLDIETLLKIVLGLIVLVVVLEVLEGVLKIGFWLVSLLPTLLGLLVVGLIVLWLLDRL